MITKKQRFLYTYGIREIPKYILRRVEKDSSNNPITKTLHIKWILIQYYYTRKGFLIKLFGKKYIIYYFKLYGFIIKHYRRHKLMKQKSINISEITTLNFKK